ncbi:hypothetical protein Tco_0563932 [Tanacetum coccineum]
MKSGYLDLGGGGKNKKKNDTGLADHGVETGTGKLDSNITFPELSDLASKVQNTGGKMTRVEHEDTSIDGVGHVEVTNSGSGDTLHNTSTVSAPNAMTRIPHFEVDGNSQPMSNMMEYEVEGELNMNLGTTTNASLGSKTGHVSYAKLLNGEPSRKSVNFRTFIAPRGNGADVAIPLESIQAISERFTNSAYGFFLGKRVAYPVVGNYVKNTWSKYRLLKSMLCSSNGLFFFQFSSKDGLDAMLENGP